MKIATLGVGYVGLVTGTCFAELGHNVICSDIDEEKISNLKQGIIPIYEPGLNDLVNRNSKEGRLSFTTDIKNAVKNSDVIFICVGTPPKEDGSTDLAYVESASKLIAEVIDKHKVIITKSTVPVGTTHKVKNWIKENISIDVDFDVVSNPEFLREGEAVMDFMIPDRVVVGIENDRSKKIMEELYHGVVRTKRPIVFTDILSSELIKYGSNSMLALRISFMNELSRLCDKVGADIKQIAHGMGLDSRIGPRFLQAGAGYGGSCFGKDARSLVNVMETHGIEPKIMKAAELVNEEQKERITDKIKTTIGDLNNKTIAIWGLSFKPKTDDMRDAPSITIIENLKKLGAKINAFDPEARENAKKILNDVNICDEPYQAAVGASALVIVTEWNTFRNLDKEKLKTIMTDLNIIDARNIYDPIDFKDSEFNYVGVGRK
tara:strand:+ start:977 stop:2278 length:1302 start_codon:yes stop_codon:yes gene_type:complete